MKQNLVDYWKVVLTIVLAIGMFLSSNSRMISHDYAKMVSNASAHQADSVEHGHTHDEIVSVMDAYHGHDHDVADHDHNIAFLPLRTSSGQISITRIGWALAQYAMPDRREFDLDRPPRV